MRTRKIKRRVFEVTNDSAITLFLQPLNESNSALTTISITDSDGNNVEGAQVLRYLGGDGNWQLLGSFTLDGELPPLVAGMEYMIVVSKEGFETFVQEFTGGEDVIIELTPVDGQARQEEVSLEVLAKWFRKAELGGDALPNALVNLKILVGENWLSCDSTLADYSGAAVFYSCRQNGVEIPLAAGMPYRLNASVNSGYPQSFTYYAQEPAGGILSNGVNFNQVIVRPYEVNLFLRAYSIISGGEPIIEFFAQSICADLITNQAAAISSCDSDSAGSCEITVDSYSPCSLIASAPGFLTRILDWEKIFDRTMQGSSQRLELMPVFDSTNSNQLKASLVLESVRELAPNPRVLSQGEQMHSDYLYEASYLLSVQNKSTKISPALGLSNAQFNSMDYSINQNEFIPQSARTARTREKRVFGFAN